MALSILFFAFLLSNEESVKTAILMDGVTTCKYETLHNVTFEDIKHVPDNDHVITLAVLRKTILNFIRKERT